MKKVYVDKIYSDAQMVKLGNTFVKPHQIKKIFNEDIDVYNKEWKTLRIKSDGSHNLPSRL